jgi:putative tryptophan/tyrosine transport system substrate-binding protein
MRRREFIALLGSAAAVWPCAVIAQQTDQLRRIGTLDYGSPSTRPHMWEAFKRRLRDLGYVEGSNITLEVRWAHDQANRLPALAAELAKLGVDVIVTSGTPAALAAKEATNTIPIVMATSADPLSVRLIASLARPGGNVTGVATLGTELGGKRLELLREIVPTISRLALLWDEATRSVIPALQEMQTAARLQGVSVQTIGVRGPDELDSAFLAMAKEHADALVVLPSVMLFTERKRLAELAVRGRMPTVMPTRDFAEAGALIAYGADLEDSFRRAANYVDKIIKGANPAELPVEQASKFELIVNLKTAAVLGLTVPPSLLARVDEVIE